MKTSGMQNHTLFTTSTLGGVERYWFGFQGQEAENEIWGEGNASFYKYRISDNRLGRFFSVDPLYADYPFNSPYAFSENRVIDMLELEGLEAARPPINRGYIQPATYQTNATMRRTERTYKPTQPVIILPNTTTVIITRNQPSKLNPQMSPNNPRGEALHFTGEALNIVYKSVKLKLETKVYNEQAKKYGYTNQKTYSLSFSDSKEYADYRQRQEQWEKEYEQMVDEYSKDLIKPELPQNPTDEEMRTFFNENERFQQQSLFVKMVVLTKLGPSPEQQLIKQLSQGEVVNVDSETVVLPEIQSTNNR